MKKVLAVAAVAALGVMGASGAQAQTATQQVTLSATVDGVCKVNNSTTGPTRTADVTSLITDASISASAVTISGTDASIWCNDNVVIRMKSLNAGILGPGTPAGAFVNKIHYTATASASDAVETLDTSTATADTYTAGVTSTAGAFTDTLDLAITTQATGGGSHLLEGAYADTLTVEVSPAP